MLNKNQNTDRLIQGIKAILEDRCSLSDEDVLLLNECIVELERIKFNENSTPELQTTTLKVVELLLRFFIDNETLQSWLDVMK